MTALQDGFLLLARSGSQYAAESKEKENKNKNKLIFLV